MVGSSDWHVVFYTDSRGGSPVEEFLAAVPAHVRAQLAYSLHLLEEFGVRLREPHASHVEGAIWELRGGSGRLFYFAHTWRRCVVLHGYVKKSQRTPKKEIATAHRRWQDFLSREEA